MDDAFIARIADEGILTPLRITERGVVISGWRRRQAAIANGLGVVPVWIEAGLTENLIARRLIETNADRSKSLIERIREFGAYKELNDPLMRKSHALLYGNPPQSLLQIASFRAAELSAEQAGLSHKETQQALELLVVIEDAERGPETETVIAGLLRHTTVAAAHEHAIACGLLRKGGRSAGSFNDNENSKTE